MTMVTLLALLSALVLLSNTMTTLIGEQTQEIAAMKAIGATRRQIRRIYRRTALLLGAIGRCSASSSQGSSRNPIVGFFASTFFAISPGGPISTRVVIASLVLGILWTAAHGAARDSARHARAGARSARGGAGAPRRCARARPVPAQTHPPLPRTAQIGVRSVTRRARRTIATVAQIALAVGTLVGVLALMNSVTSTTEAAWNELHYDLDLNTVVGKQLDAQNAHRLIRSHCVAVAQPVLTNTVKAAGKDAAVWGLSPQPMFEQKVVSGVMVHRP